MVDAILRGAPAMRGVNRYTDTQAAAGPRQPYANLTQLNRATTRLESPYLPRFPNENDLDYEMRRKNAPLTNIYSDISRNLASKPFSKTLQLAPDSAPDLLDLADNIDGQGNNLHVFARDLFKCSLDKGISWILIDYTKVAPGATLAQERQMGARPYWVHVPADRLVAVYADFFNGEEILTHARIYECYSARAGYDETQVERVRVFNRVAQVDAMGQTIGYDPATWELWELQQVKDAAGKDVSSWVMISGGAVSIGIIPLVPFISGERDGVGWQIEPPLKDLAYMQVEEFQQESNLKTIKELTAFPMLSGNGVTPPTGDDGKDVVVPVGPRAVLFAPPTGDGRNGQWAFIEPTAASLNFLQADLEKLRTEMRNLGMQPLTETNLTVITTANVSMKAHNAVQAWALGLKDALEEAWEITCLWLGRTDEEVMVQVHTDFGVDFEAGTELTALLTAEAQAILSKKTLWDELKRRGVLSDDFDPEVEEERLAEQQQGLPQQQISIDPVTGEPLQTRSQAGNPIAAQPQKSTMN